MICGDNYSVNVLKKTHKNISDVNEEMKGTENQKVAGNIRKDEKSNGQKN